MNVDILFKEKLSKVLFLEVGKELIAKNLKVAVESNVYMPLRANAVINKMKSEKELQDIPFSLFVEGMFFVLGCDEEFKYNNVYINIIRPNFESSSKIIKSKIFECIKEEQYIDGYIMLKGLATVEKTTEVFNNLLQLANKLRLDDKDFVEEQLEVIEAAKLLNYAEPYLYEAMVFNSQEKFREALTSIELYLSKGGNSSDDIVNFKSNLSSVQQYESGKELVYEEPKKALQNLLPLLDSFEDNVLLYFYIAVAYRVLENHEKAIYYLNEALAIDSTLVEVVNELGLNYASLQNYEQAIAYFRKAFEVTRSIEICTNLIMCYINSNNMEQAKLHLNIAKKIDPKDEIVLKLQAMLEEKKE